MLVAGERRRKALHTLVQDVRTAFWRTACAQTLGSELRQAIAEAEDAVKDAQRAEKDGLRSPLEPLRYQNDASKGAAKGDELALLRVRYKGPQGGASQLIERPIRVSRWRCRKRLSGRAP